MRRTLLLMAGSPTHTAVVVGGGPGGLMAAEVMAAAGVQVTIVEHMPSVGRKFVLAGRSGLNLTHSEPVDQMLTRYGPQAARLELDVQNGPSCRLADLNCDNKVDGADLGILLGDWGPGSGGSDLNHDGKVDGADLGILLGEWR